MDFHEVIHTRCSIRKFKAAPVEPEKLERIWRAVQAAPSACNLQPWRFLVVRSAPMRARVHEVLTLRGFSPQTFALEAPLVVIALGNRTTAWKRDGESILPVDVAIATEHLVLAAAAEGLGTCWIAAFNRGAMHKALGLGPEWEVVALTPLGYPDETPRKTSRKPIAEIVQEI